MRPTPRVLFERGRLLVGFAWFDLWVGAYVNNVKRTLYVCPLPMVVIAWSYGPESPR